MTLNSFLSAYILYSCYSNRATDQYLLCLQLPSIFLSGLSGSGDNSKILNSFYFVLINRAGGLYGRVLTEVASTDQMQVKILPYRPT